MRTVLVVGATGRLGGMVARRLLASSVPVRALGRNPEKLRELEALGASVVRADLLDRDAVQRACGEVDQIFATANGILGSRRSSPNRVDLPAYRNLCAAAKQSGARRLVHVSFRGSSPDSVVDYFRVKWAVERLVVESGVPYVVLRPSAFMDVWADVIFGAGVAHPKTATLFGGGRRVTNFIAMHDVADVAVAVLARADLRNECIEIGGPSNATFDEYVTLVERALGTTINRRSVPAPVMRVARFLVRPINEVASRMVALGYWTTLEDRPFDAHRALADRFGVSPRALEAFVAERYRRQGT